MCQALLSARAKLGHRTSKVLDIDLEVYSPIRESFELNGIHWT